MMFIIPSVLVISITLLCGILIGINITDGNGFMILSSVWRSTYRRKRIIRKNAQIYIDMGFDPKYAVDRAEQEIINSARETDKLLN